MAYAKLYDAEANDVSRDEFLAGEFAHFPSRSTFAVGAGLLQQPDLVARLVLLPRLLCVLRLVYLDKLGLLLRARVPSGIGPSAVSRL